VKKTIVAALLATAANYANAGTVLVVLSDQAQLDLEDGKVMQTGFFLNELMQPVQIFIEAGQTVVFATPGGEAPTADQKSNDVSFWAAMKRPARKV
jgi:co-chaperonin GroES (HSP10)